MKTYEKLNGDVTHIICYSGGHSSARVAMIVAEDIKSRPNDKIILLNHDISNNVEHYDIKRFKDEVASNLGLPITYANYKGITDVESIPDQFDVCIEIGGFKFNKSTELCTYNLKTLPFHQFLEKNYPCDNKIGRNNNVVIYYGFDKTETSRIQRRSSILGEKGYYTDFPLAFWDCDNLDIVISAGIAPPLTYQEISCENTYGSWKHANCVGCLKAGKQHWYCVFISRPDIWEKAKLTEDKLKHSIIREGFLEEYEELFTEMKNAGIPPTEHIDGRTFWAKVRRVLDGREDLKAMFDVDEDSKPCECIF